MRAAIGLISLFVVAASPASATPTAEVEYRTPASYEAEDAILDGARWIVLVFNGQAASFTARLDAPAIVQNVTTDVVLRIESPNSSQSATGLGDDKSREIAARQLDIVPGMRSAVYIQAERIRLSTEAASGSIDQKPGPDSLARFTRESDRQQYLHRDHRPPGNVVVSTLEARNGAVPFSIEMDVPHSIEWFDAAIDCRESSWCPGGGGPSVTRISQVGDQAITTEQYSWETLHDPAELTGRGAFDYAIIGGEQLDLSLHGSIRLPLATAPGCPDCISIENQTLLASGHLILAGNHWIDDSTIGTGLSGDIRAARLDEVAIDPRVLGLSAAAGAAVVFGVLGLKALLGALFTKQREGEVLELPRRRHIFEAIAAHPGVSFRELTRLTGFPFGNVRHHLDVLLRHDKIVQRPHRATLRFFENHGKYDHSWLAVAILRDAETRILYEWLATHPDSAQRNILTAMRTHGWPRTATQRRLQRLVDNGLATCRSQGRLRLYALAEGAHPQAT